MPNLSLGAGNSNGLGFFEDAAGDDAYTTRGETSFGAARYDSGRATRELSPNFGVFVDAAGENLFRFANDAQAARFAAMAAESPTNIPSAGGHLERGVARTMGRPMAEEETAGAPWSR